MSTFRMRVGVGVGVLATALLPASSAQALARCVTATGFYVEHPVTGADCPSPVGLCIAGTYHGAVSGEFEGRATMIIPTADTPATTVQLFTSDSTINARVTGRTGTLTIKNAGAFAAGGGSIVDVQTVVAGTGQLTGATGALRAEGRFTFPDGGQSRYTGTVCLP
jgi:hypothetical protein